MNLVSRIGRSNARGPMRRQENVSASHARHFQGLECFSKQDLAPRVPAADELYVQLIFSWTGDWLRHIEKTAPCPKYAVSAISRYA